MVTEYIITKVNGRWITKGGGLTVGIHKTQQDAIEAGKVRAKKERTKVSWVDSKSKIKKVDFS